MTVTSSGDPQRPARRRVAGRSLLVLCVVGTLLPGVPASPAAAQARGRGDRADEGWAARRIGASQVRRRDRELLSELPASTRLGYHPETGRVRFLSGTRAKPLEGGLAAVAAGRRRITSADARSAARRFIDRYGELFGVRAPERELRARRARRAGLPPAPGTGAGASAARSVSAAGRAAAPDGPMVVRFDQLRNGIAVMGGQIAVQVSEDGEVLSAAGELLPSGTDVEAKPRIGAAQARRQAGTWFARQSSRARSAVALRSEGLGLYDPRLMDDPALAAQGARLVWRIDASAPASASRPAEHRLVLIDALGGGVLTSIGRIVGVERIICDNRARPGRTYRCAAPYTRTEGRPASGIRDVDSAYRLMGVVDRFLVTRFGRNGLDNEGARMKATVRYCNPWGCPWRNAEWKWREQMSIYGTGWAKADDIVAHELTHGLLDHEVPLFYHYQSGAINESLADVFGELIDLSYSGGTDTAGSAWRIGEDAPIGAFRDMRSPGRFGHPDRVRSPRWHTGAADDGGVHRNSGVGNKAAFLIAKGGRFNGQRITGVGLTRTARIYYQALSTRLTPSANYVDLADALVAACTDLVGSYGIRVAHCASVRAATRATQMHLAPKRGAPRQAPLCPAGTQPLDVFLDDLEDPGSGNWVRQRLSGTGRGWYYPQNPNNDPAWDGTWASSGQYNFYAPNRASRLDSVIRMRDGVELPARAYLRFEHGYSFDRDALRRYDGGVVELRVGNGSWRSAASLFTHGGYNGRIAEGRGNALAGKRAFTGSSHGWSSARVRLGDYAGRTVRVRFRMASDRRIGGRGWYIDDVRIYTCSDDGDRPEGSPPTE